MCAATRIWATLDAFVEDGAVLGRKVANNGFIRALLKADPYDAYHFFLPDENAATKQHAFLADAFPALERRGAFFTTSRLDLPEQLAAKSYHCFHLSDPVSHAAGLTALRNVVGANIFSITSVTHSLSYVRFMADFLKLLWPGVCPRDAIIVTSESAKSVMERVFASLRQGYGLDARSFPAPELALIPLGVDPETLPRENERPNGARGRAARTLRADLDIGGRVMILSLARFSPADKMDCLPLLAALRRAKDMGLAPGSYVLVLAGWAEQGDALPEALAAYGRSLGLELRLFLRPSEAERRALYAAADIFVSPVDNIQESFGLTVAEAQASGLPVVASDFDGYRDIVADGESGLLAPTLGFAHTVLSEARSLFWYDNQYLLGLAQQTAVSVPDLALALARLCNDADLRLSMGHAARARASRLFLWPAVLARLCLLWDDLAARPIKAAHERKLRQIRHPQTMRFADFFQGHFTTVCDAAFLEQKTLRRTTSGEALYRGLLPTQLYAGLDRLLDEALLRRALVATRKGLCGADLAALLEEQALQEGLPLALAREKAAFVLLWALKHDYLEIVNNSDPASTAG